MKGQIAIELILLVVVVLVLIQTMVIPFGDFAKNNIDEAKNLSLLEKSAKELRNSINYIALSDDNSSLRLDLFLPENTKIKISGTDLNFILDSNSSYCKEKKCYKTLKLYTDNINLDLNKAKKYSLLIKKEGGNVLVEK